MATPRDTTHIRVHRLYATELREQAARRGITVTELTRRLAVTARRAYVRRLNQQLRDA